MVDVLNVAISIVVDLGSGGGVGQIAVVLRLVRLLLRAGAEGRVLLVPIRSPR